MITRLKKHYIQQNLWRKKIFISIEDPDTSVRKFTAVNEKTQWFLKYLTKKIFNLLEVALETEAFGLHWKSLTSFVFTAIWFILSLWLNRQTQNTKRIIDSLNSQSCGFKIMRQNNRWNFYNFQNNSQFNNKNRWIVVWFEATNKKQQQNQSMNES